MGQKVHPYSIRIGITKGWLSRWFADKRAYPELLHEDIKIRTYIKKTYSSAAISHIDIMRASDRIKVDLFTARPGVIIGRRGADIDRLKEDLQAITGKTVYIDIKEIKEPALDAQLVAENISLQLEKRVAFRRAMKRAVSQAMNAGAEGIKLKCSGRLGGADMSRREGYKEGKIPLQTFKADIDYGFAEAKTTAGTIGVKVWIYRGEKEEERQRRG